MYGAELQMNVNDRVFGVCLIDTYVYQNVNQKQLDLRDRPSYGANP